MDLPWARLMYMQVKSRRTNRVCSFMISLFLCRQKKSKSWTKQNLHAETSPLSASENVSVDAIFPPNSSHVQHWKIIQKLILKSKFSSWAPASSTSLFQLSASALSSRVVEASAGIFGMPRHSPAGTRDLLNLTGKTVLCLCSLSCLNTLMCP